MSTAVAIRPERTFEQYSRGAELVQAIRDRWEDAKRTHPYPAVHVESGLNIMLDHDLTDAEWHYWYNLTNPQGIQ